MHPKGFKECRRSRLSSDRQDAAEAMLWAHNAEFRVSSGQVDMRSDKGARKTKAGAVWSRDEVVRVDFERGWVFGPGIVDGLEGGWPSQPLQVLGEVVGRDEGEDVGGQASC